MGSGLRDLLTPRGDRVIFWCWVALCLTSLAVLWSVTEPIIGPYENVDPGVPKSVFWRQMIWAIVGYVGLVVASRIPLRHLDNLSLVPWLVSLVLLILVPIVGPVIMGARRWLVFGPVSLQPAELAKVSCIILNASLLARGVDSRRKSLVTGASLLLTIMPAVLVLKQPDLGTSLVFGAVWVGMIFWFGMPGIFLLVAASAVTSAVIMFYSDAVSHQAWPWGAYLLLLLGVLYYVRWSIPAKVTMLAANVLAGTAIPIFWTHLKGYQQDRVMAFFKPAEHAFSAGYQTLQSKVAIGSGGLFGTHYLKGTQKGLAFLPERQTDFIFSVVGEELGFVGAVVVVGLFFVMIMRGVDHAAAIRKPFSRFLAVGIVAYLAFHVVVNVSITTGLMPVTGIPLPLMSYGGSNLLVTSSMLGLLLNVSSRSFDV
jgi:rod shape determining protein RodA